MTELTKDLLQLDPDTLLENDVFLAWARNEANVTPAGQENVAIARAILRAIMRDEPIAVPSAEEKAADFATLLARIDTETAGKANRVTTKAPARIRRLRPLLVAAASVLLLLSAFFLFRSSDTTERYVTASGELTTVSLPDGTEVTLNANSTLSYDASTWENADRQVTLDGEAFFNVTKKPLAKGQQAFVVNTAGLRVRVLGTRFNVRERRGTSRVFLEEGKVDVHWKQTQAPVTKLVPGEVAVRQSVDEQPEVVRVSIPERYAAWTSGNLVFSGISLGEALLELGDIYALRFTGADEGLLGRSINSAGIPVNDQVLALGLLGKALGIRFEEVSDSVLRVVEVE